MTSSNKPTTVQVEHDPDAQHINIRMMQNVLLIWLDASINESSTDYQNTTTHLRRVMNTINTFTDADQCVDFLEEVQDDKVCMVISASLGQHIVPCIHDMPQVDSIFVLCANKQYHEQWAKDRSKMKGIYTDIELICGGNWWRVFEHELGSIRSNVYVYSDHQGDTLGDRVLTKTFSRLY